MTLAETKKLIEWAEGRGLKRIKVGTFEAEFYTKAPEPMNLDPKSLAKALTDSMPPDSAMLFASTEDPNPEHLTPEQRENRFDG